MEIVESGKQKNALILSVKGRMDVLSAPELEICIDAWVNKGERSFLIDLSELVFISSAGLRAILIAAKKLEAIGGKLELCGPKDAVEKVLTVSGFRALVSIHASVDAALEQI